MKHALVRICLAAAALLPLSGCGPDSDKTAELNKIPLTVDPPGGAFTFRPWVTVTKESLEEGTGSLIVRAPGDQSVGGALFGSGCQSPFFIHDDADKRQKVCAEVARTGELHFYLDTWFSESDVRGEYYTITLPKTDPKASIKEPAKGVNPKLKLTENDTVCSTTDFDGKSVLTVAIQVDLPAALKRTWTNATIELQLPKPVAGKTYKFDYRTERERGAVSLLLNNPNKSHEELDAAYDSGLKGTNYDLDTGVSTPLKHAGHCTVTIAAWAPGAISHGTYQCGDLFRRYDEKGDPALLGKTVSVNGDWYCDGYSR